MAREAAAEQGRVGVGVEMDMVMVVVGKVKPALVVEGARAAAGEVVASNLCMPCS